MTLYGYELRDAKWRIYCSDGQFHHEEDVRAQEAVHPSSEYRVQVFKTKQAAAGKARFLSHVTTIEEYRR